MLARLTPYRDLVNLVGMENIEMLYIVLVLQLLPLTSFPFSVPT